MKVKYFVALAIVLPNLVAFLMLALGIAFPQFQQALDLLAIFAFGAGLLLNALMMRLVRDKDFMDSEFDAQQRCDMSHGV